MLFFVFHSFIIALNFAFLAKYCLHYMVHISFSFVFFSIFQAFRKNTHTYTRSIPYANTNHVLYVQHTDSRREEKQHSTILYTLHRFTFTCTHMHIYVNTSKRKYTLAHRQTQSFTHTQVDGMLNGRLPPYLISYVGHIYYAIYTTHSTNTHRSCT